MILNLLILALSPLLLVQGLYVKRTTIRLPEAGGARTGETGAGSPLRLLILGDSAAAGVGTESQQDALSGHLASRLSGKFHLFWQLWAETGRTSRQCLALLEQQHSEPFDAVLVSLGVNDVTSILSRSQWLALQCLLADQLMEKFKARHVIFTSLPPMHHFPALPQPLRWVLGLRAKQFNRGLKAMLENRPGCHLLVFDLPMQAEYIASDGFHPSAVTYALWAGQAAELLKRLADESHQSAESRP
jgi:lysophospholipase L1-like esterase